MNDFMCCYKMSRNDSSKTLRISVESVASHLTLVFIQSKTLLPIYISAVINIQNKSTQNFWKNDCFLIYSTNIKSKYLFPSDLMLKWLGFNALRTFSPASIDCHKAKRPQDAIESPWHFHVVFALNNIQILTQINNHSS